MEGWVILNYPIKQKTRLPSESERVGEALERIRRGESEKKLTKAGKRMNEVAEHGFVLVSVSPAG